MRTKLKKMIKLTERNSRPNSLLSHLNLILNLVLRYANELILKFFIFIPYLT